MTEWFKEWFSSPNYLKVYSHRNIIDAEKLLKLIINTIKLEPRAKILDAACGPGRHSLFLKKQGYNVFGFDLSKNLLLEALRNFKKQSLYPNLFLADIRNVPLKTKFDLILVLFTSFGYFNTDKENFIFPKLSYKLLNEGKFFVLDFLNKDYLIDNIKPETKRKIEHLEIIERRGILNNRIHKKILVKSGEHWKKFSESVRLYSLEEIQNEFSKIGYRLEYCYGDYNGKIYDRKKSERMILFFKK
jgi:SAM-dependent methyltransferase